MVFELTWLRAHCLRASSAPLISHGRTTLRQLCFAGAFVVPINTPQRQRQHVQCEVNVFAHLCHSLPPRSLQLVSACRKWVRSATISLLLNIIPIVLKLFAVVSHKTFLIKCMRQPTVQLCSCVQITRQYKPTSLAGALLLWARQQ